MLNIEEINNTIEELENSDTTFSNCNKLASLYIVREHYQKPLKSPGTSVEHELSDILPRYKLYCEIKRKYQLHEITQEGVIVAMQNVCKEIKEFMQTLYSSTDMPEERKLIIQLITDLQGTF